MERFRGIRKVYMVLVIEGNGTQESPSREVKYFYDLEQHGGTHGGFICRVDPIEGANDQAKTP